MAETRPRVTIGIPVYNGGSTIRATIESVLNQTFDDFEVLVVDNASSDDTEAICTALAQRDSRVRYVRNETMIVQDANFTKVFQLAKGEFFRWLGDDDSLDDEYLEVCVEALDAQPEASLVTTYQMHVKDDGTALYEEYTGPRPSSPDPMSCLAVMLKLLTGSRLWIDPIYSLIRRSHVHRDAPIRNLRYGDQIFACELAMTGPFAHVPRCLASRGWKPPPNRRTAHIHYAGEPQSGMGSWLKWSSQRLIMMQVLMSDIRSDTELDLGEKLRGIWYVIVFGVRVAFLRVWRFVTRRLLRRPRPGERWSDTSR